MAGLHVLDVASLGSREFDLAACSFGLSDIDDGGKDISGSWPAAGSYYDEGRWTAQEARSTLRRQVGASHRMLSTYLGTLRPHDLWLEQIVEPVPAPDWDRLTMLTASPSTSRPGPSRSSRANCLTCLMTSARS